MERSGLNDQVADETRAVSELREFRANLGLSPNGPLSLQYDPQAALAFLASREEELAGNSRGICSTTSPAK